jgi:hypothetical protein
MNRRAGLSISISVVLISGTNAWAQFDDLEVTLTPAARAFCHVIRFPQGWSFPRFDKEVGQRLFFGSPNSDYEFRVEGVLSTKFLIRGFTEFVGRNYYTNNQYEVDLSDKTAPVLAVGRKAWESAAVVPPTRKSAFPPIGTVPNEKRLEFHGFQFNRTGTIWAQPSDYATRLSPDQAWLILQSSTPGTKNSSDEVFLDFFNADTGQKLFMIEGTFSSLHNGVYPDEVLAQTGWLTERYFIVPLGKTIERCLVCDFGGHNRQ